MLIQKTDKNIVHMFGIFTLILLVAGLFLLYWFNLQAKQHIEASTLSVNTISTQETKIIKDINSPIITIAPKYVKTQNSQTKNLKTSPTPLPRPQNTMFFINFKQGKITLTKKEIKKCLQINTQDIQQRVNSYCLEQLIKSKIMISKHFTPMYYTKHNYILIRNEDFIVDFNKLAKQIEYTLNYEQNASYKFINVPIKYDAPNTNGKLAPVYIEADNSRQLVFLWDHGKYQTFKMSGAYKNYEPIGIYRIFYKSKLAWSSFANAWMPYWMAFTKDKKSKVLIGLHGLIYYCPGRKGKYCKHYIYEPESNLGKPKSLGCLRTSVKDAKYIYSKIKVGDYIVVHE